MPISRYAEDWLGRGIGPDVHEADIGAAFKAWMTVDFHG